MRAQNFAECGVEHVCRRVVRSCRAPQLFIGTSDDFFVSCQSALEYFDQVGIESCDGNLYVEDIGYTIRTGHDAPISDLTTGFGVEGGRVQKDLAFFSFPKRRNLYTVPCQGQDMSLVDDRCLDPMRHASCTTSSKFSIRLSESSFSV